MTWQANPFFLPLVLSASITLVLGAFAYRHRTVAAAPSFVLLMAACAWWSLSYAVYQGTTTLPARLLWAKMIQVGAITVPVAWAVFSLRYTRRTEWTTPLRVALLSAVPALTLVLALTNERHGLFWSEFSLAFRGGRTAVNSVPAWGFWLHVWYSWALMSLAVLLLVLRVVRSPHLFRRQASVVLAGALLPWVGNVLHVSAVVRFPANPMPFLFTLSGAAFAWAIFRFRFLDLRPVARELVMEEMGDGVVVMDHEGRLLDFNPAAREILGIPHPPPVGLPAAAVLGAWADPVGAVPEGTAARAEVTRGEGSARRTFDLRITPLADRREQFTGRLVVMRDVSERVRMEEQLRKSAFYDGLTGLANRALFMDRLQLAVERGRRGTHPFALLFLDLDRFKVVNDSLGHHVGDELLVAVARRLEACLRPSDTVARFGGDEFAVLVEDLTGLNEAELVAERVHAAVSAPVTLAGHDLVPSASVGLVWGADPDTQADVLLRNADMAMYRAKASGEGPYEVFDREMHRAAMERLRLEADLRRAVDGGELRLYYQPVLSLREGRLAGFEALLRWEHPQRGLLAPADFMRVAEETGLMTSVGGWVLREGTRMLREWQERFPVEPPVSLTVNLSGRELAHPSFLPTLERALADHPVRPGSLRVEIAESVLRENAGRVEEVLGRLAELEVECSMDDFGTGASSLAYLHRFPIGMMKIDRSFVSRLGSGGEADEMVRSIVSLARAMGMEVTAEGVETAEQEERLRALDCRYVMGYRFAGPGTEGEATDRLAREMAPAT